MKKNTPSRGGRPALSQAKLVLRTVWPGTLAFLSPTCAHGEWDPSPREVTLLAHSPLPIDVLKGLGNYLVFPPKETGDSLFARGLALRTFRLRAVTDTQGIPLRFEDRLFRRATEAYRILSALHSNPAFAAYEQQLEVVRWLERKVEVAPPYALPALKSELAEARELARSFAGNLQPLTHQPMQRAILRRAYRALAGDDPRGAENFEKEWPQWMAQFLNRDFVEMRLRLDTSLDENDVRFLENASSYLGGFEFVPGKIVAMRASPAAPLSDMALMQRARIEVDESGFELRLSLNYAGTESLFSQESQRTILPFNFSADVEGGGSALSLTSLRGTLCLTSQRVDATSFTAAPCPGGAQ